MPRIQNKRGTAANLTSVNPTPLAGELIVVSDENTLKIGNGSDAYTSLSFVTATPRAHTQAWSTITSTPTTLSGYGITDAAPAASPTFTGDVTIPDKIVHAGDSNTAIRFPANDAVAIETAGSERIRIDSNGMVGINATPNSRRLTVRGSSTGDGAVLLQSSSTATGTSNGFIIQCFGASSDAYVWNFENAPIIFGANNAERMRLYADGKLDVTGTIWSSVGSASAPGLAFRSDSNTGMAQLGGADTWSVVTAGTERVRVDSSGRVGIGRTPSVSGTSLECAGDMFLPLAKSLFFFNSNGGIGTPDSSGLQLFAIDTVRIGGRSSGVFTEYARVVVGGGDAGNVGISTASPTAKLDINSDKIRLRTAKTPASASDTGNAGDICWDASYLYICTATNTWRRIAHSTW